jgi:hypothetical protein
MSAVGRVTARAFWGPRPQAVRDGVAAIVATLSGLRDLDPEHYSQWFDVGRSRKDALERRVAIEAAAISARLSQNGEGDQVFDDLGWTFWV